MDEPLQLVRGASPFIADLHHRDLLHASFVRSDRAHARVLQVRAEPARGAPGVAAVFTEADLGLGPVPAYEAFDRAFDRRPLATGVVRFVGEPIAVVLANSASAAADASQLVEIDYDQLPHVLDPVKALAPDAPILFPEYGSNQAFVAHVGTTNEIALEGAELVVSTEQYVPRVAPSPMEPNGILVVPDDHGLTVWASTQSVHTLRDAIASALALPNDAVRVIAPAVGGAFGAKFHVHTDLLVVAAAAWRTGRAVRWIETRTEHLLGASHGRGQHQLIEMGFRNDGTIVGVTATLTADGGAYPGLGAIMSNATAALSGGPYRGMRVAVDARGAVTNTSPTIAYRGAGRPEATAMLEFTVDRAAHRMGIDPVDLRHRNLLGPDEFPHTTGAGVELDSGDYPAALRLACDRVGYDTIRRLQKARPAPGERIVTGVGVGFYQDLTPFRLVTEFGAVAVMLSGDDEAAVPKIQLHAGTLSHGQNHTATYAAIASRVLLLPTAGTQLEDRDTALVPRGVGSASARSVQIAGSAIHEAAVVVRDVARHTAADLLEAPPQDIELTSVGFIVRGVPSSAVTWVDVLRAGGPISHEHDWTQPGSTTPYGVHAAVVELDRETGELRLVRFVAVDDCGVVVDEDLVDGQQQGGAAQGIATMLYEAITYDEEGNLRTANLADYLVPSAADLPRIETFRTQIPSPRNPIGAKGIGQSGAIGSPPAIHNAVLDAFVQLGAEPERLDPPFSPMRVWELLRETHTAWA